MNPDDELELARKWLEKAIKAQDSANREVVSAVRALEQAKFRLTK